MRGLVSWEGVFLWCANLANVFSVNLLNSFKTIVSMPDLHWLLSSCIIRKWILIPLFLDHNLHGKVIREGIVQYLQPRPRICTGSFNWVKNPVRKVWCYHVDSCMVWVFTSSFSKSDFPHSFIQLWYPLVLKPVEPREIKATHTKKKPDTNTKAWKST